MILGLVCFCQEATQWHNIDDLPDWIQAGKIQLDRTPLVERHQVSKSLRYAIDYPHMGDVVDCPIIFFPLQLGSLFEPSKYGSWIFSKEGDKTDCSSPDGSFRVGVDRKSRIYEASWISYRGSNLATSRQSFLNRVREASKTFGYPELYSEFGDKEGTTVSRVCWAIGATIPSDHDPKIALISIYHMTRTSVSSQFIVATSLNKEPE